MLREGNHHRSAEETNRVCCGNALAAGEDLKGYDISVKLDNRCIAVADKSKVAIADTLGPDGNNVTYD